MRDEVQVGFLGPANTYVTYFPGTVIEKSAVETVQRRVSYAGRYVLGAGIGLCADRADTLQRRVAEAMSPGASRCGLAGMIFHELASKPVVIIGGSASALGPSTYHYRGIEVVSSNEAGERRGFLNAAQQALGTAGWSAAVD